MTFIVEDGSGVPDANSYTTVEFADAYFTDRGIVAWAGTESQKQGWLVQATDYIDNVYARYFIGEMVDPSQMLAWPRDDAFPYLSDEIPELLQRACAQYALRAISGNLAPDPIFDDSGFSVVSTMRKVGPIEKRFSVLGGQYPSNVRPYPEADMLMTTLLRAGTGGGRVIR